MPAPQKNTSVHTIETTAPNAPPQSYQQQRLRFIQPEWDRTVQLYESLDERDLTHKAQSLRDCRRRAWFVTNKHTRVVRIFSNACRLRWCPICAHSKQRFITASLTSWLPTIDRPKFLTLTQIHSQSSIAHQIETLYTHFRAFRRRREIRERIRGGVWFFQIKKCTANNEWHPHLHCLIDAPYIPHSDLSEAWLKTTLTSSVVDIRSTHNNDEIADYVARYCARPSPLCGLHASDAQDLADALHGKRICGAWGTAKGVPLTPKASGDRTDWIPMGTWASIAHDERGSSLARAVFKAWATDRPLDPKWPLPLIPLGTPSKEETLAGFAALEDLKGNIWEFP